MASFVRRAIAIPATSPRGHPSTHAPRLIKNHHVIACLMELLGTGQPSHTGSYDRNFNQAALRLHTQDLVGACGPRKRRGFLGNEARGQLFEPC